jgi:acyl dehydratase
MTTDFEDLKTGDAIDGPKFAVSRESIRLFCDASLDYNPLHLYDDYMKGNFGKTNFGGIIMHGMNNFGLISRMITDWARRHPPPSRNPLGQAGPARRHHPAPGNRQIEADHR